MALLASHQAWFSLLLATTPGSSVCNKNHSGALLSELIAGNDGSSMGDKVDMRCACCVVYYQHQLHEKSTWF
ncbi:MAG: hypothetical protein DU481_01980 [Nitrosomonas sp.]|uniref:hypothetical protein n=1 Tax=Nitrosomonas sp. TaxID=42353 RepID=UPI0032EE7F4B